MNTPPPRLSKRKKRIIAALAILGVLVLVGVAGGLDLVSRSLVHEDELVPAEAIVVLTGSWSGNRLEEAVRLYKKGLGKWLVFSGYPVYPGTYTDTFMKRHALDLGVPGDHIVSRPAPEKSERSTFGEARCNLNLLREMGIQHFILVTSRFHTGRSRFVYQRVIEQDHLNMTFQTHGARDPDFPIEGWWKTREGQKGIFYEVTKSIYYRLAY